MNSPSPLQPYGYYHGNEADQYTFYRLPKALFTNPRYKTLSDGAKILYGLMLDRMGLSIKNNWLDDRNRVYIIFTLENVQEFMNCKHDKAIKMLAELDTDKGVGLIERVRQGQGKPAIIYVRKFFDNENSEKQSGKNVVEHLDNTAEVLTSEKPKSALPHSPNSRTRKSRSPEFGKTECNKNDISNNEFNDTDFNDTHSIPFRHSPPSPRHENVDNSERNGKEADNKALDSQNVNRGIDKTRACSH